MEPENNTVLGMLGASGGLGASSLACAVARLSVDAGTPTLLVDLTPCGGGLDQLLGVPHEPGARWPSTERATLALLAEQLSRLDGLRVLSHHGAAPARGAGKGDLARVLARPLGPAALETVARLARGQGLTVVDLPRADHPAAPVWWDLCDHVVLLAGSGPTQVCAAVATRTLLPAALGLVTRPSPGCGLDPQDVAGLLGLPLLDHLEHDPTVAQALVDQEPPGSRPGAVAAAAARVLARVVELGRRAA